MLFSGFFCQRSDGLGLLIAHLGVIVLVVPDVSPNCRVIPVASIGLQVDSDLVAGCPLALSAQTSTSKLYIAHFFSPRAGLVFCAANKKLHECCVTRTGNDHGAWIQLDVNNGQVSKATYHCGWMPKAPVLRSTEGQLRQGSCRPHLVSLRGTDPMASRNSLISKTSPGIRMIASDKMFIIMPTPRGRPGLAGRWPVTLRRRTPPHPPSVGEV